MNVNQLNVDLIREIKERLLAWYRENSRDLPWREDKDPYKIWVSEIMLQQTRVDTVIPYFKRFVERFPSLDDLASASDDEVVKAWEGLGYYSRARNLHTAVKEVQAAYGSKVPSDPEQIAKLKGIGPYTMGAILSIAYNRKLPAVDGNVMRVFARLFELSDDIAKVKTRKKMEQIGMQLVPADVPGDFNQALMELGALICVPASPRCLLCPLQRVCQGFAVGRQEELPIKQKAKAPVKQPIVFLVIRAGEQFVVEKRPDRGLLAGFWSLPTTQKEAHESAEEAAYRWCEEHGFTPAETEPLGRFEHIFSHRHWQIEVLQMEFKTMDHDHLENIDVWTYEKFSKSALANVYRKALNLFI